MDTFHVQSVVKGELDVNPQAQIGEPIPEEHTVDSGHIAVDEQLFRGFGLTDMPFDYLTDPEVLQTPEMQRLSNLPSAASMIVKKPAACRKITVSTEQTGVNQQGHHNNGRLFNRGRSLLFGLLALCYP